MAHGHHNVPVNTEGKTGVRKGATFIIGGLTSGHGVFHWFTQSLIVILPEIRETFGLSNFQVGGINSAREVASGLVSLPGGVVTDLLRKYWGLVLAVCMATFGLGWLIMGFAPIYPILLVGMAVVAMASSIWHLPAMSALSHHFSHHRGTALSFHGVGGNIGDVAAPVVTAALLITFAWQDIIKVYAIIPLLLCFLVFWAFRDIGRGAADDAESRPDLNSQLQQTKRVLQIPKLWLITLVAGFRGMAFICFLTILPLYFTDELGFGFMNRGSHIALLTLVGILFTPIMGYLSDRYGRKLVLVPGIIFLCVITLLLVPFGYGIPLIVLLILLGTFLFSDQPILTATALDIVGQGVAATTLGVLSFSRFILSAASPLIGGLLYDANTDYPFYYIAGLFAAGAIVLMFMKFPPSAVASHGHDDHGHDDHGHDDHGHVEHNH